MISGLLTFVSAPAAQAQAPLNVKSFHPIENVSGTEEPCAFLNGDSDCGDQLSDRFDGVDSLAHLTVVATQDADRAAWLICPEGFLGSTTTITQTELASCTVFGTDNTGVVPAGGNPLAPVGEAYEFFWDIPTSLNDTFRDLVVLACTGPESSGNRVEDQPGLPRNCVADILWDVSLDDAQTTEPDQPSNHQTTGVEIVSYCTQDVDGFAFGDDPCTEGGTVGGVAQTDAQIAANFKPFPHGSPIPNDGFAFRFRSSLDLRQSAGPHAALVGPAGAFGINTGSSGGDVHCDNVNASPFANYREYYCEFSAVDVPDGTELDLVIYSHSPDVAAGYCADSNPDTGEAVATHDPDGFDDECQYDAHYVVSSPRGAAATSASFQPNSQTGSPGSSAGCDTGETPDTDETNGLGPSAGGVINGSQEYVVGCMTDQFGQPLTVGSGPGGSRTVTFEMAAGAPSGAGIFGCAPGENNTDATLTATAAGSPATAGDPVLHDHNGDGRFDHCHTTTDNDGEAEALINDISTGGTTARPGDVTIIFCDDAQTDLTATGTTSNQPTGHGCADAPAAGKAQVVKHYIAVPAHIHLVWSGTGTTSDPCHSGNTFKENTIGQSDTVLACTFDANDNPATTAQDGGGRLQWVLTVSTGQVQQATRFAADPPSETAANGQATAQIQAVNEGTDFITVNLLSDQGGFQGGTAGTCAVAGGGGCTATVQKRVRRPGETQPPTTTPGGTTTVTTSPTTVTTSPTDGGEVRTVSLEANKPKVTFGRQFVLTGGISSLNQACVGAQPVTIRRTVIGQNAQEVVDTLTTNVDGTFSKSYVADKSAQYVASVDATADCGSAASTPVPVNVRVKVNLKVSDQRIRRGQRVRLTAKIAPCDDNHAGKKLAFFKTSGGQLAKFARKRLNDNCVAKVSQRPRKNTAYQARWAKQDPDHERGKSRKKSVTVRGRRR